MSFILRHVAYPKNLIKYGSIFILRGKTTVISKDRSTFVINNLNFINYHKFSTGKMFDGADKINVIPDDRLLAIANAFLQGTYDMNSQDVANNVRR